MNTRLRLRDRWNFLGVGLPVLLAAPAFGACSSSSPTGATIRVATFNVHNLFDDVADGTEDVVDTATYQMHVAAVAAVLLELNADVVALQEVESPRALDAIAVAAQEMSSVYSARILLPTNDPRGIHIAFLSRVPFDRVVSHRDDPLPSPSGAFDYRYARDCVEVWLTLGARPVALFGVHFKSKAFPDEPDKRLAEAMHTRAIANAATVSGDDPGVIVLGDFNDTPESPAVTAVTGHDGDIPFTDLATRANAPLWTNAYDGADELIDHLIANPAMASWGEGHAVTILHDDAVARASDHAPIAASFTIR